MLFSYNIDNIISKFFFLSPNQLKIELMDFVVFDLKFNLIEYNNVIYDIEKDLECKDDNVKTSFFINSEFTSDIRSLMDPGTYRTAPHVIIPGKTITVFFSTENFLQIINIYIY